MKIDPLIKMALQVSDGAVDAAVIAAEKIEVEENLAKVCIDPGCHNYGASPGCPPHVEGPEAFKRWLKSYNQALFVKIDVPMENLLSYEYRDIMRLLHEVVAKIEAAAVADGHIDSRGFAGGSCKDLFCSKFTDCNVLERNSECRNPGLSRPSMSGFGVNVSRLKDLAGWNNSVSPVKSESESIKMGAVYGLILIG